MYRNKIDNVAKFFEDKYSDERNIDYMLYNLCSEMEYDHRKFHGNVRRFEVGKIIALNFNFFICPRLMTIMCQVLNKCLNWLMM